MEPEEINKVAKAMSRGRRCSVSAECQSGNRPSVVQPTSALDNSQKLGNTAHSGKENDKVMHVLADHILYAALNAKQKCMLAKSFFPRKYTQGDTVIRQGEEGNLFYVVEEGVLSVYKQSENGLAQAQVETIGPGDSFGELALMYNQPRAATVRVESATCRLWAVRRTEAQHIVQASNNQRSVYIIEHLKKNPLFENMQAEAISRLVDAVEVKEFTKGQLIVVKGDDSNFLCVLVDGAASTIEAGTGTTLREYGPGDFFGELAFLEGGTRAATVQATADSCVFMLDSSTVDRMLGLSTQILVERREAIRAESRFGFDHNEPIIMLQKVAS